ncbi:MAG: SiaC family regulatory phosphoprotein [Bacteroidia bacterium]|nr:SiaC family regulatory phosphoprotein [Bacteroidia bacterium]
MDKVHILPTNTTPEVMLDPRGFIKIKGRAIDERRSKSPEQITDWIDAYVLNPAGMTEVTVALEFLNSFNTLILTSLLRKIVQVIQHGKNITVKWYYEEDDVDLFERGEYISNTIDVPFEFIATDKIANC